MTGYVWAQDNRNEAEHFIYQEIDACAERLRERALAMPGKEAKSLWSMVRKLEDRTIVQRIISELKTRPEIVQTVDDFDRDNWILNTPGGIIDLRSGERRAPDPAALCAKATAVAPAKHMTPTLWLSFLEETTDGDGELQRYLQKLVGYSLTGSTQEQVLAFIHGPPMTGKSVFVDTISGVFGSYHETAAADTFAAAGAGRHPADLAKMAGARLVTAVETQEGRAWDTQRIKMLTGGDRVAARFMRQDFFSYKPRYQIIIVGNHEPEVRGVDDAVMRRLHVVPFEHRPAEIDRLLAERLKDEWPGILQWAIDGCLLWLDEGLTPPPAVMKRTAEYRREEDPVGIFLEECCETGDPEAFTSRRALYNAWTRWCHAQGEDPGTLKQLRRRFKTKEVEFGFQDGRGWEGGKHRRGYTGLKLTDDQQESF